MTGKAWPEWATEVWGRSMAMECKDGGATFTDCYIVEPEVERLRAEVKMLRELLDEALAWVPERGIGGQFRDEVRQKRAALHVDAHRSEDR